MERSLRHGPNRLLRYTEIHETVLEQLVKNGSVHESRLTLVPFLNGTFVMSGDLALRDGVLRLQVLKTLETVQDDPKDPLVQTAWYSYNVSIPGRGNVFRYDSPHEDGEKHEHHRYHHRHQYDPFSDDPARYEVTILHGGDWPILHEVINEADAWYCENLELFENR